MKKLISITLACVLAFACLTALGGCGKTAAESKQAFIASQDYYSGLVETLAAPVADIDADAIADAQAAGMSGKVSLSAEGFDRLLGLGDGDASDGGSSFGVDFDFVSDGTAASGSVALTLLGETLNALFSSDGSDIAISLPDLLPRPLLITKDMLAGLNRSYNDYPDYDWELLYDENNEPYYYYSDDSGNEFFSYPDDNDYAYPDDLDDLDGLDDGEGVYSSEDDDIDPDVDVDPDDFGREDEYEYFDSVDFDVAYVSLIARYADRFLANVPESCYSSGKEDFRTASGAKELDSLTLEADGNELMEALAQTFTEIADDPGIDEIYGEKAEVVREYLRDAANGEFPQEMKDHYSQFRVKWTRFTENDATVGERFNVKLPDNEYTLETGLYTDAEAFAFIKLTDDKQNSELLDAESTVGKNGGKLDVEYTVNGMKNSFSVSGKTTERDGAKVTEADVKIGFGGVSLNIFKLTSTVRACDENAIDFDFEFSTELPALIFGADTSFELKLSADIRRDASAVPEAIDVSDAYTQQEMESEEFGKELENALKEKFPDIFELIESRRAAMEAAAADAVEDSSAA